jgi:hypothetical protein
MNLQKRNYSRFYRALRAGGALLAWIAWRDRSSSIPNARHGCAPPCERDSAAAAAPKGTHPFPAGRGFAHSLGLPRQGSHRRLGSDPESKPRELAGCDGSPGVQSSDLTNQWYSTQTYSKDSRALPRNS